VNLIPLSIALALSMRTSNLENMPLDVQLSVESAWQIVAATIEYERENGQRYLDYFVAVEDTIRGSWLIEANSQVKGARDIDFQSLVVGYDGHLVTLGGGMVTHKYQTPLKAVYSLGIPLPGGELKFITDFKRVHIWKGSALTYFAKEDEPLRPYVMAVGLADNGRLNYQLKVGMEINFR
jgi:hypothetical protein